MNTTRALILVAIAAALGLGAVYIFRGSDEPAPAQSAPSDDVAAPQEGMGGMSGMDGNGGTEETVSPDCTRYDLVQGVWVCTAAPTSGN